VPPLIAGSEDERRRQREAKLRRERRIDHKEAIDAARSAKEARPKPDST
jgi:hypothetical protein